MINRRGFTLIELLVSAALLVTVLTGLYMSFQTGLAAFRRTESHLARDRARELFLSQLEHELHNSIFFSPEPFRGTAERMLFPARLTRYHSGQPAEGVFLIEYRCQNGALLRQETPLKKLHLSQGKSEPEILYEGLSECRFDYYKKGESGMPAWFAAWNQDEDPGLPRGVRIRVKGGVLGETDTARQIIIPHGMLGGRSWK